MTIIHRKEKGADSRPSFDNTVTFVCVPNPFLYIYYSHLFSSSFSIRQYIRLLSKSLLNRPIRLQRLSSSSYIQRERSCLYKTVIHMKRREAPDYWRFPPWLYRQRERYPHTHTLELGCDRLLLPIAHFSRYI